METKTWWFEFICCGNRVRESAKTTRKTIALKAEEYRKLGEPGGTRTRDP